MKSGMVLEIPGQLATQTMWSKNSIIHSVLVSYLSLCMFVLAFRMASLM